ncbi:MAG: class A beta-lactamase, subclass A2 [Blastocatellia bacterium]
MQKLIRALLILLFVMSVAACAACSTDSNSGPINYANAPAEPPPSAIDADLQRQVADIAVEAKGKVGVSAIVLETGENFGLNQNERFAMQSVYKLPIAMAVLQQVEQGKLTLDQKIKVEKSDMVSPGQRSPIRDKNPNGAEVSVRDLIGLAVSESDGTASDVLMRIAGGATAIQTYIDKLGIIEMVVKNTEKEFAKDWQVQYDNWSSPEGAVALLAALDAADGISVTHRDLLLKFMTDSPTGPKRLKGLLPFGTVVAHKTGTSGTRGRITAATNDIGIITMPNGNHIAIAVFVADSPADEKTREAVIAKIAKAVWDRWANKK